MNRRRQPVRQFVPGGVYNPNVTPVPIKKERQEDNLQTPQQRVIRNQPQPQPQQPILQEISLQEKAQENLPKAELNDESPMAIDNNSGKIEFKKIFQNRKKASDRAREKKIRQNRQLRKAMIPKNALMALNEVKGLIISDIILHNAPGGGFTAIVCVNDNQYEGKGGSKMVAKNNACEKALRDYVISKMCQKRRKAVPATVVPMDTSDENQSAGTDEQQPDADGEQNDVDDVPMINLASFALYKLFTEWEREGFIIPEMHPGGSPSNGTQENESDKSSTVVPKEPKKPPIRTELPPNWQTMHPATVLCLMRPGVTYVDLGLVGERPNALQRLGVTVDEKEYAAEGRSKKIARRNLALLVCNTLFGTNFAKEEV